MIEFISYRWESHSIIPRQELLLERKHATVQELSQIDSEATTEAGGATAFAKGSPTPDIGGALQDVYA